MSETAGRHRHRAAMVAALAVIAVTALLVGMAAGAGERSIGGVALPAVAATTTAPPSPTSTSAAPAPIFLLADHPLLAAGVTLPDVNCALPPFRRDPGSLREYHSAFVACMDTAWHGVLLAGGMPHGPPRLNLAEHPGQTGCGNPDTDLDVGEFTALYCPADRTLYLPVDRLRQVDRGRASPHLAIVAHEYAHHVQELSGLLGAASEEIGKAGKDTAAGRELSRRVELQANCFAGLFLAAAAGRGAISRTLANQAVADFRHGALPQTHGNSANQAAWARKGYDQRSTAGCNTWSAPPDEVA